MKPASSSVQWCAAMHHHQYNMHISMSLQLMLIAYGFVLPG